MNDNINTQYCPLKNLAKEIFSGAPLYSGAHFSSTSEGVPVVNIKDINDDQIDMDGLTYIEPKTLKNPERFMVYPRDVVITCRGTIVKITVIPEKIKQAIVTANLIAIRVSDQLSPIFLAAYLRTREGQKEILANVVSSTTQIVLNPSDIGKLNIPVPPMAFQEKIANLVTSADEQRRLTIESANLRRTISNQIIIDTLFNKGGDSGKNNE